MGAAQQAGQVVCIFLFYLKRFGPFVQLKPIIEDIALIGKTNLKQKVNFLFIYSGTFQRALSKLTD